MRVRNLDGNVSLKQLLPLGVSLGILSDKKSGLPLGLVNTINIWVVHTAHRIMESLRLDEISKIISFNPPPTSNITH